MTSIAIIGLGNIGRVHLRNLRSLRGCRIAGVYDLVSRVENPGCRFYASLEEVFEDAGSHAIVIATPSDTHADLTERALAQASTSSWKSPSRERWSMRNEL
jgi:myo-inositol 2-dehydrogenase/D-chiro-inositol 1-dehydrogenase